MVAEALITTSSPTALTVALAGGSTTELHALWVRDACTCVECRRPSTNERLLDSTTIPLDVSIESIERSAGRLVARTTDGHDVQIPIDWLVEHVRSTDLRDRPADGIALWETPEAVELTACCRADLDIESGLERWLTAIVEEGAALVHGVRPDDVGLREVAGMVGEIRATNYGVTWAIEADLEPVSAVDSERHLLVHTDLPYRQTAPGVQLLLAAVADVAGGVSTLVDGYCIAEQLRALDPHAWELLTTVEFSYPFVRDDVELVGRAPIIGLHPDGRYHQIRRAPDLVGVPYLAEASIAPSLYRAMTTWTSLVDDPENEARVALEPGDLLAFDNHRLLHGRTAFELGASGRRRLLGCYLDVDDVRSRRDILARR